VPQPALRSRALVIALTVALEPAGCGGPRSDHDLCVALCAVPCAAAATNCMDICFASVSSSGTCHGVKTKEIECYIDDCTNTDCLELLHEAEACVTPAGACESGPTCTFVNGGCHATCGGVEYVASCPDKDIVAHDQGIGTECACSVDGVVIATCAANYDDPSIWRGCCQAAFAESG